MDWSSAYSSTWNHQLTQATVQTAQNIVVNNGTANITDLSNNIANSIPVILGAIIIIGFIFTILGLILRTDY